MSRRISVLMLCAMCFILVLLPACTAPTPTPQPAAPAAPAATAVPAATAAPAATTAPAGPESELGQIKANYVFEQGTLMLTPQPDLVKLFQLKPDYKPSKKVSIAVITKHLLNPYFVAADRGARKRCEELGAECFFYAPEKPDNPEEQIRMIEDAVNKKVDGIWIYAVDSKAVTPALKKAEAAGIPVVGLGTVPFGARLVTFVSADYYVRSYDIADTLVKALGEKGNVVTIDGVPGAQNATDMKSGYLDALKKYPNIKVLASQTGYWKRLEGMAAMENLLQRFPDIQGVIGADDESALGAVQALEGAGIDPKNALVVGFNATHDAICAIKEGRMYATDDADPGGLGAIGVEILVRYILDGEHFAPEIPWPLPGKRVYVTRENIDQHWQTIWSLSDEERAAGKCLR